ncbi:hypothetical protein MNNICLKF_00115 [Synechococcus sp. CBW1107]|nr:hypothetical protein MNNICLKF_00115 [Synechococcus sp. CBW1107]
MGISGDQGLAAGDVCAALASEPLQNRILFAVHPRLGCAALELQANRAHLSIVRGLVYVGVAINVCVSPYLSDVIEKA